MDRKLVKDIMISFDNYATISLDATLFDAIAALETFQKTVPKKLQPIRSIMILDDKKDIIGKIGHIGILKALEPKYDLAESETKKLTGMDFAPSIIKDIMDKHKLWSAGFTEIIKQAKKIMVKDVMDHISESVDENATLVEAIHKIIMYQVLALFVTRKSKIIGIIRLSDLYGELVKGIQDVFKVKF